MTQEQKAEKYEYLVAEGDKVNREISKIKSTNLSSGETPEADNKIKLLRNRLDQLESQLNALFD
jgi:hypothetical protein